MRIALIVGLLIIAVVGLWWMVRSTDGATRTTSEGQHAREHVDPVPPVNPGVSVRTDLGDRVGRVRIVVREFDGTLAAGVVLMIGRASDRESGGRVPPVRLITDARGVVERAFRIGSYMVRSERSDRSEFEIRPAELSQVELRLSQIFSFEGHVEDGGGHRQFGALIEARDPKLDGGEAGSSPWRPVAVSDSKGAFLIQLTSLPSALRARMPGGIAGPPTDLRAGDRHITLSVGSYKASLAGVIVNARGGR